MENKLWSDWDKRLEMVEGPQPDYGSDVWRSSHILSAEEYERRCEEAIHAADAGAERLHGTTNRKEKE